MEIITESEIIFTQDSDDFKIVRDYLSEVEKRSHQEYLNQKMIIKDCINTIEKEINKINMIDIKSYLEDYIDKKDIQTNSKESYRSYLNSFFDYVLYIELSRNRIFHNPVPNKKIYKFSRKSTDFKKISEEDDKIYTKQEIKEILVNAKKRDERDFIFFLIITVTGMRYSETLTIRIENINLTKRFIETGFVKDARKSNKALLFFIPKNTVPYLEKYIINSGNRMDGWLFMGMKGNPLTKGALRDTTTNRYGKTFKFHTFRSSLITYREINGCPRYINEVLNNHTPTSTQGKHYVKKPIEVKRDDYDKYFPYYDLNLPYL